MVKTISTPRKINAILLNIINQEKLVKMYAKCHQIHKILQKYTYLA